jgi:hypothetical protein
MGLLLPFRFLYFITILHVIMRLGISIKDIPGTVNVLLIDSPDVI